MNDPYLWLEDIDSPKALDWVRAHNARSVDPIKASPEYARIEPEIRRIRLAEDRIPDPTYRSGYIYNFWQDAEHVRGILRRTKLADYVNKAPQWETLLDVDALAKSENANWVFKGEDCFAPANERCLVYLSDGGKDAHVAREFDVTKKAFVEGGFSLPEAKSQVAWLDADHLLVATDFGSGTMTTSGYPRTVRLLARGQKLGDALPVYEGKETDVGPSPATYVRPEGAVTVIHRAITFYTSEVYLFSPQSRALSKVPFPADADFWGVHRGRFLALLRSDWQVGGARLPAGALVALDAPSAPGPWDGHWGAPTLVYSPGEKGALLGGFSTTQGFIVSALEDVQGKAWVLNPGKGGSSGWSKRALALPAKGMISLAAADPMEDVVITRYEGFLKPPTLYLSTKAKPKPKAFWSLPERFDAKPMRVDQFWVKSPDGVKIPYFVMRKKSLKLNGANPTLLYGYGGFEVSQTPYYADSMGKAWVEPGGVFVLANIRGGGEFGPRWHETAILQNRQRVFDDFISVAQDLIHRRLTSPSHLGIMGGSNGGLLVAGTFVQRPELFKAVVCQVPLLDMIRYPKLLAGASWMAEYGDPEDARMRMVIQRYSPYQNVKKEMTYPKVFFVTSTKDDRVHPGHARKMVAKMEAQGHDVLLFENIDGGHGAAANLEERVVRSSLELSFLWHELSVSKGF